MCSDILKNNIRGISLKINKSRKILYNYGSFILRDFSVATNTIVNLREAGMAASYATFSSFILTNAQVNSVRNSSDGSLQVTNYLLRNNLLSNNSNVDLIAPPALHNHNNLSDLIAPIVQEVLRSLNHNLNVPHRSNGIATHSHRQRRNVMNMRSDRGIPHRWNPRNGGRSRSGNGGRYRRARGMRHY